MPQLSPAQRRVLGFGTLALALALEGSVLLPSRAPVGRRTIVRCRDGHLFETIWIPFASFKSLRLGRARWQRCPVGHHWSVVVPVREEDLSDEERRKAHETRDVRIP